MYCRCNSAWFPFFGDLAQAVFFPIRVQIRAESADNYLRAINIHVFTSSSPPPPSSFASVCSSVSLPLASHLSSTPLSQSGSRWSEASSFVIPLNTLSIPPLSLSFISHQEKCQPRPWLAPDLKGGGGGAVS